MIMKSDNMYRIGVDTSVTNFNSAGVARYSAELLKALRLIAPTDMEFVELKPARHLQVTNPGLGRKLFVLYWEFIYSPIILPFLVKRHHIDLLHCTVPLPLYKSIGATGVKIVSTIHDVIPFSHPQWFSTMMRFRLRRWISSLPMYTHHFIAVSQFTKQSLQEYLLVPDTKITSIHEGKQVISGSQSVQFSGSKPFLLTVGTIEPRKNLQVTLKAYSLLKQQLEDSPHLVIVGGKGWGDVRLVEAIREFGIEKQVEVLGFIPDEQLWQLYREAEMLIYPSLYEGFGLPPLEAMAVGCPVITSNVSSLPEVVGDAGILVDPHNPQEIAEAMKRILQDASLAEQMRRRGLERAKLFSWEKCAQETLKVLTE